MITPTLILAVCPSHRAPVIAAKAIQTACTRWGVTSQKQVAMFLNLCKGGR